MTATSHACPRGRLRLAAALVVAASGLLVGAGPASAHAGMTPDWQYYRSVVTSVDPAVPGLKVSLMTDGEQVTLVNGTGKPVEVLGYNGEEYLRIGPSGVDMNTASLSAYLNGTLVTTGQAQQQPAPGAPPVWKHVADGTTYSWHDHRTHWMSVQAPPVVAADPRHPHTVFDWTMQLRVGDAPAAVHGRLSWTGKPALAGWVVPGVVVAVVVVILGALLVVLRYRAAPERATDGAPDSAPDDATDAIDSPASPR